MAKYIGLTIGPIYKTLLGAKKTRELWGASYIFSYIMKNIILEFKDSREFVIPYTKDPLLFKNGQEVGLFHDRFIFKSEDGDFEKLSQVKEKVLSDISNKINKHLKISNSYEFLAGYFQIYFCLMENNGEYKDVSVKMNKYLDTLELDTKYFKDEKENILYKFLNRVNNSFLIKDAFECRHNFPSILEIAACKLNEELDWTGIHFKDDDEDDDEQLKIIDSLRERNTDNFKKYHKYIAIVQADGDNLGEYIKSLSNNNDFSELSKSLFDFVKKANKLITDYGGITIYGGGDDLLFFSPIISNGKSIFSLLDDISLSFDRLFAANKNPPTLSFGLSITYYKSPMGEALEHAGNLLFEDSKSVLGKNTITYSVEKHSGQSFIGSLAKKSDIYSAFTKVLDSGGSDKMLASVIYKINTHRELLLSLNGDINKINNYFDNFYNEDIHKPYKEFFILLSELLSVLFNSKYTTEDPIVLMVSILRLKKFLEGGE